jgi:energy-coupling factor transporter ATP-binding protein EcfA2
MHISKLRIRNFRSIEDLTLDLGSFNVICGPNSCGKSNVFRAIEMAFRDHARKDDAHENLPLQKLGAGGPLLSIWIDIDFEHPIAEFCDIASVSAGPLHYQFRLTRSGTCTRRLGGTELTPEQFAVVRERFTPLYVPPIRDLDRDGLKPFRQLMSKALQRTRGSGANIRALAEQARDLVRSRGAGVMSSQAHVAEKVLGVDSLDLDTSKIDIASLYSDVGLSVTVDGHEMPLAALGTGHQSAVILHMFRQLGAELPGEVLYLFEEPDNHLHPATVRCISDDLRQIASTAQVLVSTHSPVLIAHTNLSDIHPLVKNNHRSTERRRFTLKRSDREITTILDSFGMRAIEPLLVDRVIVVEGPSDRVVLSTLFERRFSTTPDREDILIVPAGGKGKVVELATLLHEMGVAWAAVMDRDALFGDGIPHLRSGLAPEEVDEVRCAIDRVMGAVDGSHRRGRGVEKALNAMTRELSDGPPKLVPLDDSPVAKLVSETRTLTLAEMAALRVAIVRRRIRDQRTLLAKGGMFVWSGTLEDAVIHNASCETTVEAELLRHSRLSGVIPPGRDRADRLRKTLKNSDANVLADAVRRLDESNLFIRSDVNACMRFLFDV